MNIGIKNAPGELIILLSTYSFVAEDFINKNPEYINKTNADCVGGSLQNIGQSLIGKIIFLSMNLPFGVRNAFFRYSQKEGYVDTVAFGVYRKEIFDKIGFFNEELVKNQDDKFNYRLQNTGRKIFLTPQIKSSYYSHPSFNTLWRQCYQYGYWKIMVFQKIKKVSSWRYLTPVIFILWLITSGLLSLFSKLSILLSILALGTYLLRSCIFSVKIVLKEDLRFLPILPVAFSYLHFSYGIGFLHGMIFDFIIRRKKKTGKEKRFET